MWEWLPVLFETGANLITRIGSGKERIALRKPHGITDRNYPVIYDEKYKMAYIMTVRLTNIGDVPVKLGKIVYTLFCTEIIDKSKVRLSVKEPLLWSFEVKGKSVVITRSTIESIAPSNDREYDARLGGYYADKVVRYKYRVYLDSGKFYRGSGKTEVR